MMVAGFIALILNPFVVFVQRRIPRRGPAVAIVTIWAILYFGAFVAALLSIPAAARCRWWSGRYGGPPRRAPSLADVIVSANIARATIAFTLPGFHSGLSRAANPP